ncbi:MAG: nicotinamide-nucleotide adenylyltransferase [Candidatus Lokiarchaeota archaeon]|nr:nicotinamide-nucleotide adenylyltransferase [Candidatus Lokiarchaeota archaeon]
MEDEIISCIKKENIKYLHSGQISKYIFPLSRKEAHKKKIPHLIVRVFILSKTSEGNIKFLVQKRGKNRKSYPNCFTDSASGHVLYKKNLDLNGIKQDAIRELIEEFGILQKNIDNFYYSELKIENDNITDEIAYIFIGTIKSNTILKPNKEELDLINSRFYSQEELKKILENKKCVDYSKEIWKRLIKTDLEIYFEKKSIKRKQNHKIALFISRFQPLHHGHIYMIYKILKKSNFLKIGIGSSQLSNALNNPFTKEERKQFIITALEKRSISTKKYEIYFIPDIFNANKWVDHVSSIVGDFDILYSNSDWMRELFKKKGYEISKKSLLFKKKYNGTNIRNSIFKEKKQWRLLIPNEVIELIKKFNGFERIKDISEKNRE